MDKDEQELQNILATLEGLENEIADTELKERFQQLHKRICVFLKKLQDNIKILQSDVQSLKKEVENLRRENETKEEKLIVAQITWAFDAHMARFVVDDPREHIKEFGKFRQMYDYLDVRKPTRNYWLEIQNKLSIKWSRQHESLKFELREDRNEIAHPSLSDIDDLDQLAEFKKLSKYDRERMADIVNMLKMAASLMKFGRLAASLNRKSTTRLYFNNPQREKRKIDQAFKTIISWDRNYEDIKNGLQNIEHEKAKECLKTYIDNSTIENYYFLIFDFIKEENSERLGKLAWNIAERSPPEEGTNESEALIILQELLQVPDEKVKQLPRDMAKLHIPDFLPKHLWNVGIKIVEDYFN